MYLVYSLILAAGALLASPYWLYKGLRERKYLGNFRQRLGWHLPAVDSSRRPLWIHAVSVGEVLAAKPLFLALRKNCPHLPVIVSTVTITGHALARKTLSEADAIVYFPFDFSFSVRRFLRHIRPLAVLLLETELWPNFLRLCRKTHTPVLLANGRISDKSFRRYQRIRKITTRMLADVNLLCVQTPEDGERFLALGAGAEKTHVSGNLKFDSPLPTAESESHWLGTVRDALGITPQTPVVVIGSSMKGEESVFLDALRAVRESLPETRFILAPRHPERFDEVADLIRRYSIPFLRRTKIGTDSNTGAPLLLLDTIGELRSTYVLASIAVIGGSFLPFGGHNPLEPAACGKAIIFGPHMSNFRDLAGIFLKAHAARQATPETLPSALLALLQDDAARRAMGERALSAIRVNQGATAKTLELIRPFIP